MMNKFHIRMLIKNDKSYFLNLKTKSFTLTAEKCKLKAIQSFYIWSGFSWHGKFCKESEELVIRTRLKLLHFQNLGIENEFVEKKYDL